MSINLDDYYEWNETVSLEVSRQYYQLQKNDPPTRDSIRDLFLMASSEYWLDSDEDGEHELPQEDCIPMNKRVYDLRDLMVKFIHDWGSVNNNRHTLESADILTSIFMDKELPKRTRMLADLHLDVLPIWHTDLKGEAFFARLQIGEAWSAVAMDQNEPMKLRQSALRKLELLVTEGRMEPSEEYLQTAIKLSPEVELSASAYKLRHYYFYEACIPSSLSAEGDAKKLIDKCNEPPLSVGFQRFLENL